MNASVQFSCSVVSDSLWPFGLLYIRLPYASPTPKLSHAHVHWGGDAIHHLILCHPLLLPPSIFPSIRIFSRESALHIRWPEYWSFSFSISPSNKYSGWFSLGLTGLISLQNLQSINSSVLSLLYGPTCMTTRKTIALTTWTFVGKVMSLLFNVLSRFVIAFLARCKCLLISLN